MKVTGILACMILFFPGVAFPEKISVDKTSYEVVLEGARLGFRLQAIDLLSRESDWLSPYEKYILMFSAFLGAQLLNAEDVPRLTRVHFCQLRSDFDLVRNKYDGKSEGGQGDGISLSAHIKNIDIAFDRIGVDCSDSGVLKRKRT